MKKTFFTFGIISLLSFAGCGQAAVATPVKIEDVSAEMLQAAQAAIPDVEFTQALRRSDGSMEVRGKDPKGKVRDVEFDAQGMVTELE